MRALRLLTALLLMLGLMAAPAAAHNLEVSPKGSDKVVTGWVGSGALPEQAQGQGLIPGGPTGSFLQSPSHAKGLNTACVQQESNPSAAQVRGPGGPGCPHGQ